MEQDILSNVWPEWQIVRQIGRGAFGVVYEAVRRDHSVESRAAVKVISTPQSKSEIDSLRAEGLSEDATRTYLQGIVNDFVSEIQLMQSFKGVQNIVSVEDYKVVERKGEIGWDIYIRMELLTPFNSYICDKTLSEPEVIKLGIDICTALELCTRCNIIHRDIKPENIFVNAFGDFKLGDFGIARKLENVTGGLSQKGTYNYMAPEIEKGSTYDATVDLYSLGLVLYRLLNRNRLPFLDTDRQLLNPNERMNAVRRRMDGEPLPPPCDASPDMAQLIRCACAYEPRRRFASATAMKKALITVRDEAGRGGEDTWDKTRTVRPAPGNSSKTMGFSGNPSGTMRFSGNPSGTMRFSGNSYQGQGNGQRPVNTFGETGVPKPKKAKEKKSKLPFIILLILLGALLVSGGVVVGSLMLNQKNTQDAGDSGKDDDSGTNTSKEQKKENIEAAGEYGDLIKNYVGTYISNNNVRGFELDIISCDPEGNFKGVYDFYSLYGDNKLYGSQNIEGQVTTKLSDGSITAVFRGTEWIVAPNGYNDNDLTEHEVTFNGDKTVICEEERDFYGIAENTPGMYAHEDMVKTYTGTYVPNWGVTNMELTITSCDENTGEVEAEFYFYPHEHNPEVPTGKYHMIGRVVYEYADGSIKLALMGDEWIQEPLDGAKMVEFYLIISPEWDKATSDQYQIYLTCE